MIFRGSETRVSLVKDNFMWSTLEILERHTLTISKNQKTTHFYGKPTKNLSYSYANVTKRFQVLLGRKTQTT